jgi:hypothetical protein
MLPFFLRLRKLQKGRGGEIVRQLLSAAGRGVLAFFVVLVAWKMLLFVPILLGWLETGPALRGQFLPPLIAGVAYFVWRVYRDILPKA